MNKIEAARLTPGLRELNIEQLKAKVNSLIREVGQNPGSSALIHGDAHPGNFFYDPNEGLTLIDTPTLSQSIGADGYPVGPPARDFGNFEQKLANFGQRYELAPDEIRQLQQAFRQAYQSAGGASMTEEAIRFFRVRAALGEVIKTINQADSSQPLATQEAIKVQVELLQNAFE